MCWETVQPLARRGAFDAMRENVPGVSQGPGYNRKGEAIRSDRDIWVGVTGLRLIALDPGPIQAHFTILC